MKRSLLSYSSVAVLLLVLLMVNALGKRVLSPFFVDLTEDNLYSLSEGTENIIEAIDTPVTLRYYFSKTDSSEYPAIKLYGERVLDLLEQYERLGQGKITLEVYDPRPDSEEAEWAQTYGLQALATQTGESLFLGLYATNALGEEEAIPVLNPGRQEYLEYDVTKLLYSLSQTSKPLIGILSSLDVKGEAPPVPSLQNQTVEGQWVFVSQLEQLGHVRHIEKDALSLPEKLDVLLVIHPKDLPDTMLFEIDQFVMKGGKLFVAVDPWSEVDVPNEDAHQQMPHFNVNKSSDLDKLFDSWGITLVDKKVVGDRTLATKVNAPGSPVVQQFVLWLGITPQEVAGEEGDDEGVSISETINSSDVVTSDLENILIPWGGTLEVKKRDGLEVRPLLSSTSNAKLFGEAQYRFASRDPESLIRNYVSDDKAYTIALRLRGDLDSAFPEGHPTSGDAASENMSSVDGPLAKSASSANIIVVADVDFLADPFTVRAQNVFGSRLLVRLNDNLNFVQNAIENLLGSDDLISLRSRGQFARPFTKVAEIEQQAAAKWRQEEQLLQAKLNQATQRLNQLQSGAAEAGSDQIISNALLEEIQSFRKEKAETQRRLREVRRNLRQDKERLGEWLFMANTFLIPLCIVLFAGFKYAARSRKEA